MTKFPKTFNPPEELDSLRVLWVILFAMTLGDICFLWNSYSYSVGDDFLAVFMTVSTMAAIIGLPMLAASTLGAALDNKGDKHASVIHIAICVLLAVFTLAVIVFVTMLRMGTVEVTEGAVVTSTSQASFSEPASTQQSVQGGDGSGSLLVLMMTGLLVSTAVFSFARRLIDCCMTLREPMIASYRQRIAPKRLAQIDAVLAGIEARSVAAQRADDARLHDAAVEMAEKTAAEIIVDLEKEVCVASEDPASWSIAMDGASEEDGGEERTSVDGAEVGECEAMSRGGTRASERAEINDRKAA